jgi:hypothetical protein
MKDRFNKTKPVQLVVALLNNSVSKRQKIHYFFSNFG